MSNPNYREWYFQIWDKQRKAPVDDDTAILYVLTPGEATSPTIYSSPDGTSVSAPERTPRTFTNGRVRFWTSKDVSTLDLSLMTSKGEAYYYEDVAYSAHRLDIDPFQRDHKLVLPFGIGSSAATETSTGCVLPANLLVKDAYIKVIDTDATETIDVGLLSSESGGDADGFVLATSVATGGYVNPWPVVTGGTNIDYVVHTAGYGAYLKQGIAGADAVATVGGFARRYHLTDGTAKTVTYTTTAGTDTAAGLIILCVERLP
jgi:hypothetical protein